ncbi:hypothetical protein F0U62_21350 [Cystobacter fuscus]|uniref:carboxypeptidase regulatory-like domain-containing protein n=1 Tax=Cystobacter fuscus TaxID=43 RepID=UPI002B2CC50C|nr:hypothetical protein F0U62_21350 [Cystobacter fuscus]
MRRNTKVLGLGSVVLGLVLGLLWMGSRVSPEVAPPPLRSARPVPSMWSAQALAAPSGERGTETLGGRVLGPGGPVSGALVVALAPPSSEWRSVRETPERSEDMCPRSPDAQRLLEWVEAHRHEALPLAHATTDAQGRFLLEGLSRGPFVLWAESGVLLGLREGVSAGAQEQDVRVKPVEQVSGEVRDERQLPLAGVRITVLVRAAGRVVETVTGEDGRFAFGPLPETEAPLLLSKEGFLPVSHSSSPPGKPWRRGREMTLYAAHRLSGQVMDERGPAPGALVQREDSGATTAVTTDARGFFEFEGVCSSRRHVLSARQGERIARQWVIVEPGREPAPVRLVLAPAVRLSGRVTDTSGHGLAEAEVTASSEDLGQTLQVKTDTRGGFLFEPLVPGRYVVSARAPRHSPAKLPARLFESSHEVQLELTPAEPVEGLVVEEGGSPVEGVHLRLTSARNPSQELSVATSGAEGRFTLDAPGPGNWRLVAHAPDFLPEDVELSAPARDVRVVLRRGAALEAEVVDEAGRPLENAQVFVRGHRHGARVTTDARGRAVFRSLVPGSVTVLACAAEMGRAASMDVPLADRESRTVRLALPEGGLLSGRMVDARGAPVAGARLVALPAGDGDRVLADCHGQAQTQSGPDGSFNLAHLRPGPWSLSVYSEEFELDASASRGVEPEGRRSVRVRVSSGESTVQLVMRARPRLLGRVVREDGGPVTPFQLNGKGFDSPDGRFSLPLTLARKMELYVKASGFASRSLQVNTSDGREDVDLGDVVLRASVTVTGKVVDALSSAPVSQVGVGLRGGFFPRAYTRWDGHFTLEDVPPGEGFLVLSHPLYPSAEVAFVQGQQVLARLARGATLEGRVESQGVPVEVGSVQLRSQREEIVGTTELVHGRYALELLPAGRYVVRVQGPRSQGPALLFPLKTVELAAGDRVTLDFTGPIAAGSMDVLVPERGIEVHLIPGELPLLAPRQGLYGKLSAGFMGKRVSDGVRRFSLLPGGDYTLIAIRHDDSGTDVHREQVELPSEGEHSLTLAPLWTRFED